jgi:hypothetical protein
MRERAALDLLRRGESEHARAIAEDAVKHAAERFGEGKETARAKTVLAIVEMEMGEHRRARALLEEAAAFESLRAPSALVERLDVERELARVLAHAGDADEARRIAEANVAERKRAFGFDDVAYADGLEALAEVLLLFGDLDVALDRIGEAVGIYFSSKHSGIAQAVAIEAEILATVDHHVEPFAELGELPLEVVEEIAIRSLSRARRAAAKVALRILSALRSLLVERLGESHPATVRVLAGIANTERELGNHQGRRDTLNALIASFDCIGAIPQEVEALIQRAISEVEIGEPTSAITTLKEAVERAEEVGSGAMIARCLRMSALLFIDLERTDEARADVVRAIAEAVREGAAGREELGRCSLVQATVLARAGDRGEAGAAFERGRAILEAGDPELLAARAELDGNRRARLFRT